MKVADEKVGYCGIYCGCCVMQEAKALSDALKERISFFGEYEEQVPELKGNWGSFMKVLDFFSQECKGCRSGGGNHSCQIRACAQDKEAFFCGECDDFPCEKIGRYRETIQEIRRMGTEEWLKKQRRKEQLILRPLFEE